MSKVQAGKMRQVGLVGAGYIADWHAKSLASVAGVRLAAVCDTALSRAEALAGRWGAQAYNSLDSMLAAGNLDAVHILLPPDLHFPAAQAALVAGVDVLLEKPMCATVAEGEALAALAAERGRRLAVGHNFLFSEPWQRLRSDVRAGLLGPIDEIRVVWNRFLPQSVYGPFDTWMLRDERNIALETGSHAIAFVLDLVGESQNLAVRASDPIDLPTGRKFYRRWQVDGSSGVTAIELRMRFIPAYAEFYVHVRGRLAAATADLEHNTYTLHQHFAKDLDFATHAAVSEEARSLRQQANRTLKKYIFSKLHLEKRGSPYGESIARAMDAFYASGPLDERIAASRGVQVLRQCERIGAEVPHPEPPVVAAAAKSETASVLVLGGTGFIGRELVRQLVESGRSVRLLVRSTASLPADLHAKVEVRRGNTLDSASLQQAMQGVETVVHLARANVKTWAEYQKYEIEATRLVGEAALAAGVRRLIYSGTIDSYYAGGRAGSITEATPLDPQISRRNLYARAKAESEELLQNLHRERGLPLVIVRPGIVIGRGGSPFHWGVGMWWSDAVCQIWGEGRNKLPLVLVEDVARGLIAALDAPGIEGRSFNLVADPCLTAQEYLDELDRAGQMRIDRRPTFIASFYRKDIVKWMVKLAVRFPERRMPSYRDWESRTQKAHFDCSAAKQQLGWQPVSSREELVRKGIVEALASYLS
ncbi:NAD-dependent epimerase/dehydratase family protein [Telmatobacter bradus]|uniref:NAD-dependent epimerase/dehydratase family protein n=1 Tax=Telmatobacter bradus TaxID=474953 RepID=UPI003B42C451